MPAEESDGSLGGADFVVAVRQHSHALHAYLARRAGKHTADDLLSEVWLRAFRSRHNLNPAWTAPGRGYMVSPATRYGLIGDYTRGLIRQPTTPTIHGIGWTSDSMRNVSLLTWRGR